MPGASIADFAAQMQQMGFKERGHKSVGKIDGAKTRVSELFPAVPLFRSLLPTP